jgi:hypothetical protein
MVLVYFPIPITIGTGLRPRQNRFAKLKNNSIRGVKIPGFIL